MGHPSLARGISTCWALAAAGRKPGLVKITVAAWIKAMRLGPADPLFRPLGPAARSPRLSPRDVDRIVKRRAGAAYNAHSTRVGAAVEMREAGVPTGGIMQSGGWSSDAMPARYTRQAAVAESGAAILARRQGRAYGQDP